MRFGELHDFLLGDAGFEAAAAAGFVHSGGSDDDEVVRFDQALGVLGGVAAADADGKGLGDGFGETEQLRHGAEGAAEVIRVEAGDDDLLAAVGQRAGPMKFASSTPTTSVRQSMRCSMSLVESSASDFMRRSPCETISSGE
jgi:hypothetical protein